MKKSLFRRSIARHSNYKMSKIDYSETAADNIPPLAHPN